MKRNSFPIMSRGLNPLQIKNQRNTKYLIEATCKTDFYSTSRELDFGLYLAQRAPRVKRAIIIVQKININLSAENANISSNILLSHLSQ